MSNPSRSFSVYLLKDGFDEKNSLKANNSLGNKVKGTNLPADAVLYVLDNPAKNPWWRNYWGIRADLKQTLKGAIVFLKTDKRNFALTFGHTYHFLKTESYEHDFGILTTLNAVDPEKIKSTDILIPENARRERIQSPTASELTFFDINSDESIFKSLAGAVKEEYFDKFRHVSGASNVRLNSKLAASDIKKLCETLFDIYIRDDYKQSFPNIQSIQPVRDPIILHELDLKLVEVINNKQEESIYLTIPDVFNPNLSSSISYSGSRGKQEKYDDVNLSGFYKYLADRNTKNISLDSLKKHKLKIHTENGYNIKEYSIYACLLFDCKLSDNHFHLCDGNWYAVDSNFLKSLTKYLDPYFISRSDLPDCDLKREDEYNASVAKVDDTFVCLDKTNISPKGQTQIEPCDLFTVKNNKANLIHIKISTRSSSLSHLFNQGVNSIELVRLEQEAREKLIQLVNELGKEQIEKSNFIVSFGIITNKDTDLRSASLPLFSKISLKRALRDLQLMSVEAEVILIKDQVKR